MRPGIKKVIWALCGLAAAGAILAMANQILRADVIAQDPQNGHAAVAVDVLEARDDGTHRWVGTWYLVRGANGWLLDQPQLTGQ